MQFTTAVTQAYISSSIYINFVSFFHEKNRVLSSRASARAQKQIFFNTRIAIERRSLIYLKDVNILLIFL